MKEAQFYDKKEGRVVQCRLCPNECTIPEGKTGICKARKNEEGLLFSTVYGKLVATSSDPIEKKPFYHFLPGSESFSISTKGCNFKCLFCQNWDISQKGDDPSGTKKVTPQEVVDLAKKHNCQSIAYTYVEPTIFYEFILDTAKLAKTAGIKNVIITNGYINPKPLKKLYKYIDAVNIDLKFFDDKTYQKVTGGHLDPVLNTIYTLYKRGVWIEITNLIIPGLNDDRKMIKEMCEWIKNNINDSVPLHFSRFFPKYKMNHVEPTSPKKLEEAYHIAKNAGLKHVYIGNIPSDEYDTTFCSKCNQVLIRRNLFNIISNNVEKKKCKFCNASVEGIFE
ncbi:AmmeMemoRadiSam system radical SAM enzyme [Candidatus Woesearchaeota archaeon]|jgi:pyruvate formate lyase activating enzyme|nr:AmmeMemoRadiSam system radical SAM enzyme [Candidatus Woesearchaeota archaeon]MBT6519286.1 AmmeMemoRadiSam system radical SAM enzyme [Candidatus Woesearchaeota archaeon]MBT7367018.1 AmmeMemoRadiSam system radical SAM enzyme [Candidatus Woesearchaeota archaeon]